MQQSN
jgi:RNA recognition motif-containing protein